LLLVTVTEKTCLSEELMESWCVLN